MMAQPTRHYEKNRKTPTSCDAKHVLKLELSHAKPMEIIDGFAVAPRSAAWSARTLRRPPAVVVHA